MNLLFYLMMSLTGACIFGLVHLVFADRSSRATSQRAQTLITGTRVIKRRLPLPTEGLKKKLFEGTHWLRARLGMSIDAALIERFERAGMYTGSGRDLYLTFRLVGPLLALVAATFIPWNRTMFLFGLPGIAYLAPDIVLSRLIARRKEKIRLSVPDAVDLLVICVDAGLGLDQAMLRVAVELSKSHPELQQEFLRINREQKAGKLRLEAWQSMADRNQLPELEGFVNMLAQTERFGTPIARALSAYGDGIRQKRRQHAEELAAKTTVKIIFPLVLCIFPAIFIVLLGPPGLRVARGLAGEP